MIRVFLQNIIEESIRFEDLPANWNSFDIESFSKSKRLWDYQQSAVKNALNVLWKYYEDFVDYQKGEILEVNQGRRQQFLTWYENNGLEENLDIKLDKRKRNIYNLLTDYYPPFNSPLSKGGYRGDVIPYEHFINRMCFWMATGSGKTLVIIKLIQILSQLIERGEIPPNDILILTHRNDLIEQFKTFVDEFNYGNETKINLRELKEYPEIKRQGTLFGITVFYYRSDNLSDEQKEKIIDFKNYDNDGKWYIFLDEAHKGDREESKRQHIYSILSRNGFLFNSSATFVDPRDVITCAYEFNLSSFINKGYGKHITILKQEIKAFKNDEDYSSEDKQKIVLKSLILLTYVKKFHQEILKVQQGLYHNPLLLVLVNSVNTEDADLKLFFRELERIGKGDINNKIFKDSLNELWEELKQEPEFMFEEGKRIKIDGAILRHITKEDVLNNIYNSKAAGEIEILRRQFDRKELAFKLKTSDKPFALIKIGDISSWLKDEFVGYEIQERFEDESFFESLNEEDSEINILMGSRSFYEGWDSNRPNVINFINIGIGVDARKFILQSVGRGVRIEPIENRRKRLMQLYNIKDIDEILYSKIKNKVLPVETLCIFGTNRDALEKVVKTMEIEKKKEGELQLSLFVNEEVHKHPLLIPIYKIADQPILKQKKQAKFEITDMDFCILSQFANYVIDDRVLLMKYSRSFTNFPVEKIKKFRESIVKKEDFYCPGEKNYKNLNVVIERILDYFSAFPEEFREIKKLTDEIRHFKNIKVYLKDINELKEKIDKVKDFKDPDVLEKEVDDKFDRGEVTKDEYKKVIKRIEGMVREEMVEYKGKRLRITNIAKHYYIPLIVADSISDDEKTDYIKHIIKVPSEIRFISDLEKYLAKPDNKFEEFDWWLFSKLDESLDDIYIPYFNPNINKYSPFHPDFIFWLKKGVNYFIVFVDPKGTEHTAALRKIDGYEEIFMENGRERIFSYNGSKARVRLYLRTKDVSKASAKYRSYWFDNIEKMLESLY